MAIRVSLLILGMGFLAGFAPVKSQGPPSPSRPTDEEMRMHIETLRRRLDDPLTDLAARTRLTLEITGTLDRAAGASGVPKERRALWREAAEGLDQFNAKNPDHPQLDAFKVQATVYQWARGRSWSNAFRANPRDDDARKNALQTFEECSQRFQAIVGSLGQDQGTFAQNARFRFAQTLSDEADLLPADDPQRARKWNEAVETLKVPISEASLVGFADLLRGSVLARLGRFDEASKSLDAASKSTPAPPESEQVDARLTLLIARRDFASALKIVDLSHLDADAKSSQRIRIRLDEVAQLPGGPSREAVETALFSELKAMRAASRPELKAALTATARTLMDASPGQEPAAWDLLAEGAAALDDLSRAGKLESKAADQAESRKLPGPSMEYRLRAGAYYYRAEKFEMADPILTRVAESPGQDRSRPRAALLRAMSRGRALALGRPGGTQADYASALRYVIANFPKDPAASEARWLLGKYRLAESDREHALELWKSIPPGEPRWLDSRIEIAAVQRLELNEQRLNNDRPAIDRRLLECREFLATCLSQARDDNERNALLLANVQLELTPTFGRPEEAQKLLDRVQHSVARPQQRDSARRLSIVALAQLNRWVEAEQIARREIKATESIDLFPAIRILDQAAAEAESDLRTRRLGLLLRILLAKILESPDSLPADLRAESGLRMVRALLFSGDQTGARQALARWTPPPMPLLTPILRDLADTYTRLESYSMAIDVQRLRGKLAATGSSAWFDARYGLAVAYYRSGKLKDAVHLIDATAILHPDLGGGELRDKFIRLRQRIDPPG